MTATDRKGVCLEGVPAALPRGGGAHLAVVVGCSVRRVGLAVGMHHVPRGGVVVYVRMHVGAAKVVAPLAVGVGAAGGRGPAGGRSPRRDQSGRSVSEISQGDQPQAGSMGCGQRDGRSGNHACTLENRFERL